MYTSTVALGLVAALAAPATAFFRMPCPGRIVTERADPIISPGKVSGHVHTVSGGNAFDFDMTYDDARASDCSSCPIKQDLSNYWTPKLYYQYENGSFQDVHQSGDGTGIYGGMTVYYLQRGGPNNDALKAFPEGFRMVAGDPFKRNHTDDFASEAISFVCLDYDNGSSTSDGLPTKNCPDGLRAQVFFPSCWDGENLDSADHKSHMAYPVGGSYDSGTCPDTHPVHLISIFFEVNYNTGDFGDMWYGSGQPFVFAQGDPTGYGFHGDFLNGWDIDTLQSAIDTCTNDSGLLSDCPVFDLFTTAESQACIIPPRVDEQVTGVLEKLPGCNSVQDGPEEASVLTCTDTATIGAYAQYFTDVTSSLSYEYIGCGSDSVSDRTLSAASTSSNTMTVETCVKYCSGKGYTYAGLEYASQCYCGDDLASDRAPVDGILGNCFTPCAGDSTEYCGGGSALSLYKSCNGSSSCTNAEYAGPVGSVVSSVSSAVSDILSSSTSSSGASSSQTSASASATTLATSTSTSASAAASSTSTTSIPSTSASVSSSTSTSETTSSETSTSTSTSTKATSSTTSRHRKQKTAVVSARDNARFEAAMQDFEVAERQAAEVKAKLSSQKTRRHLAELKRGVHH